MIYYLSDPRIKGVKGIRYIGYSSLYLLSTILSARIALSRRSQSGLCQWIKSLTDAGVKPTITSLGDTYDKAYWMDYYAAKGCDLLNRRAKKQKRNRKRFERAMKRLEKRMRWIIRHTIMYNRQLSADDVYQDALLRCWQCQEPSGSVKRINSYYLTIAKRTAIDAIRFARDDMRVKSLDDSASDYVGTYAAYIVDGHDNANAADAKEFVKELESRLHRPLTKKILQCHLKGMGTA